MPRLRRSTAPVPEPPAASAVGLLLRGRRRYVPARPRRRSSASAPWPSRPPGGRVDLPDPLGHLQATGIDAAGRKQYRYHDAWRARRDREKFDEMLDFAGRCRGCARASRATSRPTRSAATTSWPARRACSTSASSASARGLRRAERVLRAGHDPQRPRALDGRRGRLRLPGQERAAPRADDRRPRRARVLAALKRRRGGARELLAYRDGRRWVDVRSDDINEYLKDRTGAAFTAKDFRTWNGTVLAAVALARRADARHEDRAQARDHGGGQARSPTSSATRRRSPHLLRRPARDRRLPGRRHHRAGPRARAPHDRGGRARPDRRLDG